MYQIRFVDDHRLPAGHDFVLVEIDRGALIAFRESAVQPHVLENAWAAFRALGQRHRPTPTAMPALRLLARTG